MPDNADVWRLWARVRRQWRHNGFSAIGLDLPAVYMVAGTLGVEMTEQVLDLLLALEDETLLMDREQTATG